MNKGQNFWHALWSGGQLPFHKEEVNPDLIKFWPKLDLLAKSHVFVPLCGKSLDLLWLIDQGYQVTGIELCETAVLQLMAENNLFLKKQEHEEGICFRNESLCIWVADIFTFNCALVPKADAIYDRAALNALPEALRQQYVNICLDLLLPDGRMLLKTLDGGKSHLAGPPYRVTEAEVARLYNQCELAILAKNPWQIRANDHIKPDDKNEPTETVWLIKKVSG